MTKTTRRVGVVLFQLGGPDTLAAIEPFLYNLFCDPDIIDFPFRPHRAQTSGQTDFDHARPQSAASLRDHRRRLAHPPLHRAAGAGARGGVDESGIWMRAALWPCATGIRLPAKRSQNCRRRSATKWCCCPCIRSILRPRRASSLNEWQRLFRGDVPVHNVEHFLSASDVSRCSDRKE